MHKCSQVFSLGTLKWSPRVDHNLLITKYEQLIDIGNLAYYKGCSNSNNDTLYMMYSSRKFMLEADVQDGTLVQVVMQGWMQLDKFRCPHASR